MIAKLAIVLIVFSQVICFGHGSWLRHYEDIECILGGYGDAEFKAFFKELSSGLDKTIVDEFRAQGGIIPGGVGQHRILGHGWSLNNRIPKTVLDEIERTNPGKSQVFIQIWRKHVTNINQKALELTGFREPLKKEASALASLMNDIHLLGDWEPDNTELGHLLDYRQIIANINKDVDILFGKNSKYAKIVHKHLDKYLKKGLDPQIAAEGAMGELYKLRMGDMLNRSYGKYLKTEYSIDRVVRANQKIAARPLIKIPGVSRLESSAQILRKQKNIKFVKGVLQEHTINGKVVHIMSVPISPALEAGIKAGVLTLIFTEGRTLISFASGNITEEEFLKESAKNCGASIVTGTTTFVLVGLGFTPTGWVVIGVGIAAELVYEVVFDYVYEQFETKVLTLDDIMGRLPTELQRRKTVFDPVVYQSFFDCNKQHESQLLPQIRQRESFFDPKPNKGSFFDEPKRPSPLEIGI